MSIIQQVINKAMVFALTRASTATSSVVTQSKEFRDLLEAVSRVNAKELEYHLDEVFMKKYSHWAPCSYMEIYENEHVSASVFTVRGRREIPLHDHPTMYGIVKVIQGRVRVNSYSFLTPSQRSQLTEEWNAKGGGNRIGKLFKQDVNRFEEEHIMPVIEHGERILGVDDPPTFLTPTENNIHRVQAVDEEAAFFDILMPPYFPSIPSRDCHYFRVLDAKQPLTVSAATGSVSALRRHLTESENGTSDQGTSDQQQSPSPTSSSSKVNVGWLMRIPAPRTYFCDTVAYRGPIVKSMTETELRETVKKSF